MRQTGPNKRQLKIFTGAVDNLGMKSKEDFESCVKAQQDIQKRNPYGSAEHRRAYEAIRALIIAQGYPDCGDYEE